MIKKVISLLFAGILISSFSLTALAGGPSDHTLKKERDIEGQGIITARKTGDKDMIDVSFSANGFLWYVNEDTRINTYSFAVRSGAYKIINNSDNVNLEVALLGYGVAPGGAEQIENSSSFNNLKVNLTGALAADGLGQNILHRTNFTGTYSEPLKADSTWEYGFDGTYTALTLPSNALVSDYVLSLGFKAISVEAK